MTTVDLARLELALEAAPATTIEARLRAIEDHLGLTPAKPAEPAPEPGNSGAMTSADLA